MNDDRRLIFDLDALLLLRALVKTSTLDRWSADRILQLSEDEAAKKLIILRKSGYLIFRGRGRGTNYDLRRDLADRLRGIATVNAELPLEKERVQLRPLTLLKERGKLTNAEIRQFSGFSRVQVYRLVKKSEEEGKIRFAGKGRSAYILPSDSESSKHSILIKNN